MLHGKIRSSETENIKTAEEEIIIADANGNYTDEFKKLLTSFYLKL